MSEKKWSCKWKSSGRRGRTHKGKEYPRHALKYYDGNHLGMRKRIYSKSQAGAVWREGRPALMNKYIIGLLNKYVGKTYEEFKFVFDQKTKNLFKKYDISWCKLEDYLHDSPQEAKWHEEFYVDDEGFIRKCKQVKRYHNRGIVKKKHINFNSRVKLPDWGQVRTELKYAVGSNYCSWNQPMPPQFRQPLLLGEFYVQINNQMVKLPVYTCNQNLFVNYYNYRDSEWDCKLRKYVYTPFWKSTRWSDREYSEKKRYNLATQWMKVYVHGIPRQHNYWVRAKNIDRVECEQHIERLTNDLNKETDPIEGRRLMDAINSYKERLEKLPIESPYNMGYGPYYTFIKRSDYEDLKK